MKAALLKVAGFLYETKTQETERRGRTRAAWDKTAREYKDWAILTTPPGQNWIIKMIERAYSDGPIQVYYRCLHIAIAELIDDKTSRD